MSGEKKQRRTRKTLHLQSRQKKSYKYVLCWEFGQWLLKIHDENFKIKSSLNKKIIPSRKFFTCLFIYLGNSMRFLNKPLALTKHIVSSSIV